MKKVLVTGAGGAIGEQTVKKLLELNNIEITTLDLRTRLYHHRMKKYRKKINIVYGDVSDTNLINELVQENDYIIHLAGVMPPLANLKESLLSDIDYRGTENILKAISYYNPECFLIYPSTTSVYNLNKENEYKIDSKLSSKNNDYYSQYKIKIEKLITRKIKNYVIYRIPLVLNIGKTMFYNIKIDNNIEIITIDDLADALSKSISDCSKINQNIYNLTGGTKNRILYKDLLIKILKYYGLNLHILYELIFLDKDYNIGCYLDSNLINKKLNYQKTDIDTYFENIKNKYKFRIIRKFLALPVIYIINLKYNKKRVG